MKKLKKKKNHNFIYKKKTQIKRAHKFHSQKTHHLISIPNSEPTKINKRNIAISIYFFSCSQYLWKVREKELTGKWLCRWCSLEILSSGAGEGVAEVDRSFRERKTTTVASGWCNGDWFETWSMRWWGFGARVAVVATTTIFF